MGIVGRWHGYASQAILGETPFRVQKPGAIGDLIFEPNGKMYTEKPKTFGSGMKRFEYFYEFDPELQIYGIFSEDYGEVKFWATVSCDQDELVWRYADDVGLGQGGCCLFFKRG